MATLEQIKELRDQTQVSVALCKEALEATGCDMDKAKLYLRRRVPTLPGKATRSVILYLNPARKRWKALPKATVSSIPTALSRLTSVVLTAMRPGLYGAVAVAFSCVDRQGVSLYAGVAQLEIEQGSSNP